MKNTEYKEFLHEAKEAMLYANLYGGKLIINDSIEIAKDVNAHGIHVGLLDAPVSRVRDVLGKDVIIGGTANTIDDIKLHVKQGADYIGLGPFKHTTTKKNLSPVIGLHGYKQIVNMLREEKIETPVIGVGGITFEDIDKIKDTGLHGVAISGALLNHYKK